MKNKNRGITLIALIITIIIMLILVAVSINIAIKSGLFETAGKAAKDTKIARDGETELSEGKVNIGGTLYENINDFVQSIDNEVVTFYMEGSGPKGDYRCEFNVPIGTTWEQFIIELWPGEDVEMIRYRLCPGYASGETDLNVVNADWYLYDIFPKVRLGSLCLSGGGPLKPARSV